MAGQQKLEKMLLALLKSQGLVEWIGGYVYGATSNGDPYIILYPAAEHLKEKVCRVYPHQFRRLPAFISTEGFTGDTDANPDKEKAQKRGIYHECPAFQIVMHLGRETQMGREKRFSDVLYVPAGVQAPPTPAPAAAAPEQPPDDQWVHWWREAGSATDAFMFDTAVARLEPWYGDGEKAATFRGILFGEAFDPAKAQAMAGAMLAYAKKRRELNGSLPAQDAHKQAKAHALAQAA
jgi:hypothetical protein